VRQGKFFELDVAAASAEQAKAIASEVADKVLANPVIESFKVEVEPA
jgi:phosphoribosylformylglycinamidine synthase